MKRNQIMLASIQFDAAIEERIRKRDADIKQLAEKNAKHFAKRNLPNVHGDELSHYIDELKTGYEKLSAEIFQEIQPAVHFPDAKIDADYFKEKDTSLDTRIQELTVQNQHDEYEIENFNPGIISARIRWALISTFIITIGEILFNTKALQITGDNMLFSFIISLCISFAVFIFSHLTPLLYKGAKNRLQRIIVLGASLLLVTGLFIALAIFRSTYLALHNVHVNPFYFVIINLFFFTVSSLLSFFVLPTWQEIKQNAKRMKLYHAVIKRNKEIERIKGEKIKIREVIMERTKQRVRIINCINYAADRFRKMYKESIAVFKRTNLAFRTDRETPDCFSQMLPEADINEVAFHMNKHS